MRRAPAVRGRRRRPRGPRRRTDRPSARCRTDAVTRHDDARRVGERDPAHARDARDRRPLAGAQLLDHHRETADGKRAPTIGDGQVADDRDPGRRRACAPASATSGASGGLESTTTSSGACAERDDRDAEPRVRVRQRPGCRARARSAGHAIRWRARAARRSVASIPTRRSPSHSSPATSSSSQAPVTSVAPTRRSASDPTPIAASESDDAGRRSGPPKRAPAIGAHRPRVERVGRARHGRQDAHLVRRRAATPDSRASAPRRSSPVPAPRSPRPTTRRRGGRRPPAARRRGRRAAARCRRRSRTRRSRSTRGGRWPRARRERRTTSASAPSPASPVRSARGAGSGAVPILRGGTDTRSDSMPLFVDRTPATSISSPRTSCPASSPRRSRIAPVASWTTALSSSTVPDAEGDHAADGERARSSVRPARAAMVISVPGGLGWRWRWRWVMSRPSVAGRRRGQCQELDVAGIARLHAVAR